MFRFLLGGLVMPQLSATLAFVAIVNNAEAQQAIEAQRDFAIDWKKVGLASVLLIVPCFWHEYLVCVDLGSHTYAAWMAKLATAGKAPGIYVVFQKTNILFDWLLSAMCAYFGYDAGEKIAVAITVLIFYWGGFAFLSSFSGKPRWDLAALLAMFAYGWTFQTGLFNYYLSIGLALAALAAFWTRETRGRVICLVLLPLILLAHPLGICVFVGFAIFEAVSRRFGNRGIFSALLISIVIMMGTRVYLTRHYYVKYSERPFWITSGPDQLILYSYIFVAIALITSILLVAILVEAYFRRPRPIGEQRRSLILAGSLYLLIKLVIILLPDNVLWSATTAEASLLVNRATLVAAILAVAVIACLPARRWKSIAWGLVSLVFFLSLYFTTGNLSRLQRSAYDTVRAFPPGTRFVASGNWQPLLGVLNAHLAERACVARCFVLSNYEIASKQFRVRSQPDSPLVESSIAENDRMQNGTYIVRDRDLPVFALHPCPTAGHVCVGKLAAGDRNGNPSVELGTAVAPAHP
jgi:hypothetical protein